MLEIKELGKTYNGKDWVVQDFHLSVAPQKIIALLGESGSGKTTVLRIIAGFESPSKGSVSFNGREISSTGFHLSPEKRGVGMVFQDFALFPHITVKENILYGLFKKKKPEAIKRVDEVLALVGMQGLEQRYPHQLSGGQQQRVALARALAPEPSVLLLDEPFSSIDGVMKEELRNDLKSILRKAGITVLYVTHDTQAALSMADEIVLMRQGKMLQYGSPRQIYEHPQSVEAASFFGLVNVLEIKQSENKWRTSFGLDIAVDAASQTEPTLIAIRPQSFVINQESFEGSFIVDIVDNQYYGEYRLLHCRPESSNQILLVRAPSFIDQPAGKFHIGIVPGSVILIKCS